MNRWMALSILLGIALIGVLIQTGAVAINTGEVFQDLGSDSGGEDAPTATAAVVEERDTPTPVTYTTAALTDLNRDSLERHIADLVNDERESRGISPIGYDYRLVRMARQHSIDMARNDYVGHSRPGGPSLSERFDSSDYDCSVSAPSLEFERGGEAVFQTWYKTDIDGGYGDGHYSSRNELARAIVHGWKNSEKQSEVLFESRWRDHAVGVAFTEVGGDVMVFVTYVAC